MWEWYAMVNAWNYLDWLYGPRLDWLNNGIFWARAW